MSNEIEIGEYVRTIDGYICKILRKTYSAYRNMYKKECYSVDIAINTNYELYKENIVKHSKNIIDLIEVGDYVNGGIVTDYYFVGNQKVLVLNNEKISYEENENFVPQLAIKTIVTKEQLANMEYKVGV